MFTKREKTNSRASLPCLPRPLRAKGGKLHLGVKEGGQGISQGVRGVFKPLQILLGLRLVIRKDVALTNRRQINADLVRAHHRQGFLYPGVERLPHPLPSPGVESFNPTLQRRPRHACRHPESSARQGVHGFQSQAVRDLGVEGLLQGVSGRDYLSHLLLQLC